MLETFIDVLPAYDTCAGSIDRINLLREFSGLGEDYYYKGWGVPVKNPSLLGNGYSMDPLQTFEENISVPPGTFITAISGYSQREVGGFTWNIEEVESQSLLVIGTTARSILTGTMKPATGRPGPTLAWPYFIVGARGLLKVTLINLSTSVNLIQLLIETAVPVNAPTMQRVAVKVG